MKLYLIILAAHFSSMLLLGALKALFAGKYEKKLQTDMESKVRRVRKEEHVNLIKSVDDLLSKYVGKGHL